MFEQWLRQQPVALHPPRPDSAAQATATTSH
jgi:hypothetical protein